jgi:hypothetical protein
MMTTAAIWPLVYAMLAFLMFRATHASIEGLHGISRPPTPFSCGYETSS